jgi:D-arabinose 1-dehydrogenase-like Zn-dependent alcohol dehydrogenase
MRCLDSSPNCKICKRGKKAILNACKTSVFATFQIEGSFYSHFHQKTRGRSILYIHK